MGFCQPPIGMKSAPSENRCFSLDREGGEIDQSGCLPRVCMLSYLYYASRHQSSRALAVVIEALRHRR